MLLLALACTPAVSPPASSPAATTVSSAPAAPAPVAPAPAPAAAGPRLERLVAIGDLHADLPTTIQALMLAGLTDKDGHWTGGKATFVQTGDITDRGPDSKEVIELLDRLEEEASAAGGRFVPLLGNHEVMNLRGDLRYVSEGDVADFGGMEARSQAFGESGALGRWLRGLPIVAVVDRVVFCHGGVTPAYAKMGLEKLNSLVPSVLAGALAPEVLGDQSPIWYRGYLLEPEVEQCPQLEQALASLGAERMVVGHTTQDSGKIAVRCGGRLLGIDTGVSSHYGAHLSALELRAGDARALYPSGPEELPDP